MAVAAYFFIGLFSLTRLGVVGLILLAPALTIVAVVIAANGGMDFVESTGFVLLLSGSFAAGALTSMLVTVLGAHNARR